MVRLSILLTLVAACGGDDAVETRGCNQTGFALDALMIDTFDGSLAIGACTAYEQHDDAAYGYTYVRFLIGQDEFVLQPIDFVGETPLAGGRWSYQITIADYATRRADVQAVPDN